MKDKPSLTAPQFGIGQAASIVQERKPGCTGKQRYETVSDSDSALRALVKRKGHIGKMRSYFCRHCQGWHYGHPHQPQRHLKTKIEWKGRL